MREIKFRLWDKGEKKLLYPTTDEWLFKKSYGMLSGIVGGIVVCPNGRLMEYKKDIEKVSSDREDVTDDYELMQYTGLKDKEGEEIYELMELNDEWRVIYQAPKYVLQNISSGDIIDIYEKQNKRTITKEYSPV